jgi:hypothetical protein
MPTVGPAQGTGRGGGFVRQRCCGAGAGRRAAIPLIRGGAALPVERPGAMAEAERDATRPRPAAAARISVDLRLTGISRARGTFHPGRGPGN